MTEETKVVSGGLTPGPWAYRPQEHDDWGVVRSTVANDWGWYPIVCQARYVGDPTDEDLAKHRLNKTDPAEANARLIAAAPDLVEALDECLNDLWDHLHSGMGRDDFERQYAGPLAALAKAREGGAS